MNTFITVSLSAIVFIPIGWMICVFRFSRDKQMVRLQEDEAIVKKPPEGMILIAASPEVSRKVVGYQTAAEGSAKKMRFN